MPPEWATLLREQGRSVTWLAAQVGVSRQYLSGVASGARSASPALSAAIERVLANDAGGRLDEAQRYASWRGVFMDLRADVADTLSRQPELAETAQERVEQMADESLRVVIDALAQLARRGTL